MHKIKQWNRNRKAARDHKKMILREARLKSFGRRAIGVLAETEQGLYVVNPGDRFVSRRLLEDGVYGLDELDRCYEMITADSKLLVVGTHIGAIAIPLSKRCKSMVAIEANPDTYKLFEANLKLNDCGNVKPYNFAAAENSGSIEFILSRDNSGGSKRKPIKQDLGYIYDKPKTVLVQSVRLDDLLQGQIFDLIFMDIEGSEYFALQGMQSILSRAGSLVIEFIPHHLANVASIVPRDLVSQIIPHFSKMYVPTRGTEYSSDDFLRVLEEMFTAGKSDDGLIFTK